ncbi:5-formyltetrahydrofolate cyclo-ligase [Amorphus orientalis]|uniref:5-formyltetrahydrofolate cyclo-ligase n=1 Tax=Amorphus orientalis TaxID=649198 RepID=A0AAE3VSV8_9HYPH|nr:5-formyltetrahydrofolate cyclo-ligase [Amorphus orientalis]MDQ0316986.1 5-formyltetrahydrofolate cyclo-ligase [Amorphus orientalis]
MSDAPSSPDIAERKAKVRAEVLDRRAALTAAEREAAAQTLVDQIPALDFPEKPGLVAGFWPIRDEIDIRPLMTALAETGHRLALPVIAPQTRLVFREWSPGDTLRPARFGTFEPGEEAPECDPMILLVPLVAFDREGARLGYGKGHYDGAIARLSAIGPLTTVGVAFATQEVDIVPMEPHDRHLDAVLTEAGLLRFDTEPGEPDAPSVPG